MFYSAVIKLETLVPLTNRKVNTRRLSLESKNVFTGELDMRINFKEMIMMQI